MAQRKIISGLLLAGLMAVAALPGHAGPTTIAFVKAQGMTFSGAIRGGTATLTLIRYDGADVTWEAKAFPVPKVPAPREYVGAGPLTTTLSQASAAGYQDALYIGCITVKTSKGTDKGCELLPPSTINVDPVMNGGTITFSVRSSKVYSHQINAVLIVTGTTAIAPAPQNKLEPTNDANHRIVIAATQLLTRGVTVVGSVRSEEVGGGAIGKAKTAQLFTGFDGVIDFEARRMACAATTCVL